MTNTLVEGTAVCPRLGRLFQVGFSHLQAPLAARERAAVAAEDRGSALAAVCAAAGLSEAVLLSTCARLELYAAADEPKAAAERARLWLLERGGLELGSALVCRSGQGALEGLFRVAAGLESWILGESEILGQVKRAYELAKEAGRTGPLLNRAFQSALAAGKEARARTSIQNGISSIGGAAALLARSIFGNSEPRAVVVFGAGQSAEAVARHLAVKRRSELVLVNRTLERAAELAARVGGRAAPFDEGLALLEQADAAVFSTASPEPLLQPARLAAICARRRRPLLLIDLGLPRNVAPACAGVPGAHLHDLDSLKRLLVESLAGKAPAKLEAEALVARAAARCAAELEKGLRRAAR